VYATIPYPLPHRVVHTRHHEEGDAQALVSLKKYMTPPLTYFKVNICPLPLPHFASIFFRLFVILSLTQLYRYTPEIFLFSTATFKYKYRAPLDELEGNIQRKSHFLFFSQWNGYNHFRFTLDFSYAIGIL
jgi:hypothetical protein